jgi:ABC-type antimicrobial peptide transport system permease subunit
MMPSLREAVRKVDPNLPLSRVSTQAEQVEGRFSQERLFASSYAMFGALALVLASIGLFGLMSYTVARRTNEIGIRMALGAQRPAVLLMVLGESLILVLIGVGIGVACGIALGIKVPVMVSKLLFNVPPIDPIAIAVAVATMVTVSLIAGFLPAWRASRVDPMIALRDE